MKEDVVVVALEMAVEKRQIFFDDYAVVILDSIMNYVRYCYIPALLGRLTALRRY